MKYIVVSGGVISGVGKGVIASSVGLILKSHGYRVTAIKIDQYINIDAGTFSPYEHGEVFVLDDGGEVDLDFGNYERFLGIRPRKDNNLTTGKIYSAVIESERKGLYLGKTVQVVPHLTNKVQELIESVAQISVDGSGEGPEICIVELGGTVGDAEGFHFLEAIRQFQKKVGRDNLLLAHVAFVLELTNPLEPKTKPLQESVQKLRSFGVSLDMLICRSEHPLHSNVVGKICSAIGVQNDEILRIENVENIYKVPILLSNQGVMDCLRTKLNLPIKTPPVPPLSAWNELLAKIERVDKQELRIGLVGKYTKNKDSYTSIIRALKDAGTVCGTEIQLISCEELLDEDSAAWAAVKNTHGIIIPGGFGGRGSEGLVAACRFARLHKVPFLGVCLGFQCAVIEVCRAVMGLERGNSEEFDPALSRSDRVVVEMLEHSGRSNGMGGSMRLGLRRTLFQEGDSKIKRLYGDVDWVDERHRHRYEINPRLIPLLPRAGVLVVGIGMEESSGRKPKRFLPFRNNKLLPRLEIIELKDHPYFVGVQFHPEYLSSPLKPSPPFLGLILAAMKKLEAEIGSLANCRSQV